MLGLAAGVFLMMLLSGWISTLLLSFFPTLGPALRYLGAAYILYLAFVILKASYTFSAENTQPMGFLHGLMLQMLNPKMIVYAFTLFATFLTPITTNFPLLLLVIILLTITAFCATSIWALFGTVIKTYLRSPRVKAAVNIILSLLLVSAAIELVVVP